VQHPHHRQSPFTALSLLMLHKRKLLTISQAEFELSFDTILQVLEEVNDEKYRCTTPVTPKGGE